jgi:hypothetical protein
MACTFKWCLDNLHDDTQPNDTQHNNKKCEQLTLKNFNSCWNTKFTFYLETSVANVIKRFTAVSYDFL